MASRDSFILGPLVSVAGTGKSIVLGPVPVSERWKVKNILVEVVSGTFTLAQIEYGLASGLNVPIKDITPAASLSYYPSNMPVILEEGWVIRCWVNAFTSSGTMQAKVYYRKLDPDEIAD